MTRAWRLSASVGLRLSVLAGLAFAWELGSRLLASPFLPTMGETLANLWSSWLGSSDALREHVLPSLGRLLAGWGLAAIVGIVLGVGIGLSRRVGDYLDPTLQFLRAVPAPAVLPLFLVVFGFGDGTRIGVIAFGVAWPILLNTIDGVRAVDPLHLQSASAYHLTRTDRLLRVILPSAAGRIVAGLRISLSMAVILMVLSEMTASLNGIGFTLLQAQRSFRMVDMWAAILLLGLIGYLLNLALSAAEAQLLARRLPAGRAT